MEKFEKPYRQVSSVKATLFFVFNRKAFVRMAVKHDISWSITESPDLRERYSKGDYMPDETSIQQNAQTRAVTLRNAFFSAGLVVALSVVFGLSVGITLQKYFGQIPVLLNTAFQIFGAGLLLWATIWELGWGIRSFGGNSLGERVHQWLFRTLYVIGTFVLVLVYGWAS